MKNKGFTLLETIIVSLFVGSVLIYLFTQLSNVSTNYNNAFSYNSVTGLYNVATVERYLRETGFSELKNTIEASTVGYVDITDETGTTGGSNIVYSEIVKDIKAVKIIMSKDDLTTLKTDLENKGFSESMKKFINSTDTDSLINSYRLFVKFEDGSFATIKVR